MLYLCQGKCKCFPEPGLVGPVPSLDTGTGWETGRARPNPALGDKGLWKIKCEQGEVLGYLLEVQGVWKFQCEQIEMQGYLLEVQGVWKIKCKQGEIQG